METGEEEDIHERPGDKHSGKITGDESQLERYSQSGQWSESVKKSRRPVLQQKWEDLSQSKNTSNVHIKLTFPIFFLTRY